MVLNLEQSVTTYSLLQLQQNIFGYPGSFSVFQTIYIKYITMAKETALSKKELSSIKHTLFDMLRMSGKTQEPDYESLVESLDGLTFTHYSVGDYAEQLLEVVESMIDLDDLGFDMGQLYQFQDKLG